MNHIPFILVWETGKKTFHISTVTARESTVKRVASDLTPLTKQVAAIPWCINVGGVTHLGSAHIAEKKL